MSDLWNQEGEKVPVHVERRWDEEPTELQMDAARLNAHAENVGREIVRALEPVWVPFLRALTAIVRWTSSLVARWNRRRA